jgi:hypothetical protein
MTFLIGEDSCWIGTLNKMGLLLPKLIDDLISWYQWKGNIDSVNKEYHSLYIDESSHIFCCNIQMICNYRTSSNMNKYLFNQRGYYTYSAAYVYKYIYNFTSDDKMDVPVAMLPPRYFYSNGIID